MSKVNMMREPQNGPTKKVFYSFNLTTLFLKDIPLLSTLILVITLILPLTNSIAGQTSIQDSSFNEKCKYLNALTTLPNGYIEYNNERIQSTNIEDILDLNYNFYPSIDGRPPKRSTYYRDYEKCVGTAKAHKHLDNFIAIDRILSALFEKLICSNPEFAIKYIQNYYKHVSNSIYLINKDSRGEWISGLQPYDYQALHDLQDRYKSICDKYNLKAYISVIDAANFLIKISTIAPTYGIIKDSINEITNYKIEINSSSDEITLTNYIHHVEAIYSNYISLITNISLPDSVNKFVPLVDDFDNFKTAYIQQLNTLLNAISILKKNISDAINAVREKERIQQEELAKQHKEREKLKQEKFAQSIRTACIPVVAELGLPEEAYDYAIPTDGMMNMLHDGYVLFGEFLCFAESGGVLQKYSSPGLFSKSHKVVIPIKGMQTTLEFIQDSTTTADGKTILRLSHYESSNGKSQKFMNAKEQEPIIGGLSFLLWVNALQNNPARFNNTN